MPIYEFYCTDCHTVFNFLSRTVETRKRPGCPRCGRPRLERKPSAFAISRGRAEPEPALPEAGHADARLEHAMESLMAQAEGLDENDPKAGARFMRRLYETAGLPVTAGLEEALRRMEAGEDPESIEEDLGDALAEDPLLGEGAGDAEAADAGSAIRGLRRRLLPPRQDPELYEL